MFRPARFAILGSLFVVPVACASSPSGEGAPPEEALGVHGDALRVCASGATVKGVDVSVWPPAPHPRAPTSP